MKKVPYSAYLQEIEPKLKQLLDKRIGRAYEKDIARISDLMAYVDDPHTQKDFLKVKHERKEILAALIRQRTGIQVDPDSIFDTQAKRLHARLCDSDQPSLRAQG